MNYYNEHDSKAAAWLRELIKEGHIADGIVDERDIQDVQPNELSQYTQCHFFAGIGGWSYALRIAGWPDAAPVWTGSCPCQPFSAAGQQRGTGDIRHLWPVFAKLIAEAKPATVFGEQVASKLGREWLAGVRTDMEALGYAVGAADLCAASVGAPHIRQRLYWVADPNRWQRNGLSDGEGCQPNWQASRRGQSDGEPERRGDAGGLEYATGHRREQRRPESGERCTLGGCWDVFEIVHCTDGKARRFEPGSFPLAHGVSGRVGLLRGYGNAIPSEVAAQFIKAYRETLAPAPS